MAFKIIRFFKDELDFNCNVNIDQEGIFTTYLPEDITKVFGNAGIPLKQNPARRTRTGFFSDEAMYGLKNQINEASDLGDLFHEWKSEDQGVERR